MRVWLRRVRPDLTGPPALLLAAGLLALLAFGRYGADPYVLHVAAQGMLWGLGGAAWNVIGGYGGQVSFGHAAFFGLGAYTLALIEQGTPTATFTSVLLAGGAAALVSLPFGLITFRLRGAYFVVGTFAVAEIFRSVALNWRSLTHGAVGVVVPPLFPHRGAYLQLLVWLTVIALGVLFALTRSKFGLYLQAVREDQEAAEALGVPTTRVKAAALVVSAFFTGVAGALFATYIGYIDPDSVFHLSVSSLVILVAVVGGKLALAGPLVGALLVIPAAEFLRQRFAPGVQLLAYGLLLVIVPLLLPRGVLGTVRDRLARGGAPPRAKRAEVGHATD
ncbi:MAG: branched-chain amino acid ABC transporter permease [Armatimonadota bacterium]|nr:branched-chain amino acid ABC transporter permease [Armatimonadota bacterium]MDR7486445.1 branched-chain amino acid ABC transporter permease [Armatimonadota bacterium]MDR7532211.1 branched-chain amino acid ABC transporter permease [Armatimonadota bacterium]MDR7537214.1 branched-chain amino acid ABC transporter permease [Armatimonadota bacterium]